MISSVHLCSMICRLHLVQGPSCRVLHPVSHTAEAEEGLLKDYVNTCPHPHVYVYQTTWPENSHDSLVAWGRYAAITRSVMTDKAIKSSKRRAVEASLNKVANGSDPPLENVPHFQYLGCKATGATKQTYIYHRLEIAQSVFSSLSHHRPSRTTKLRLYRVCVGSSLTHCCEAWTLNRTVMRSINGFNSRRLHVMTGEHYRETATVPAYDLVLAVGRRHLRYLGHVLCMPRQDDVMRTRGTSVRLYPVPNGQPVQ